MARTIPINPVTPVAPEAATQFFRNYTQLEPRMPMAVWVTARAAVLAIALALALLLIAWPELGLKLFWGLAIPIVPALLVVAPGLWRQVCPMATMNQLPRLAGFSRGRELPPALKDAAFGIALLLFVAAVALRVPLLNHAGPVVGFGILGVLLLALAGGTVFKGRSGWCGTFCPLAPVQRIYGQAPLIVVKNGYCTPCVGCQKSCYDFNPRAAVFSDIYDDDPRHAAQRRLFMGFLPGFILGYFLQGPAPSWGEPWHALVLLGAGCASAGLYMIVVAFVPATPANPYRVALVFGVAALVAFYAFAGPIIVRTVSGLAAVEASVAALQVSRFAGVLLALALAASGLHAEARWRATQRGAAQEAREGRRFGTQLGSGASLKDRLASRDAAEVTDRASGISFQVAADASLLEGIQAAGLKINFGCRAGVCGADPVAICEGHDNLEPAGDEELATLRRLGLEGRARLACMCAVKGPVLIDRDPLSAPAAATAAAPAAPRVDRALEAGLKRVVIVGDGVAGMGVADALRRASPSVRIDIVGNEPHDFYNRMGIGRLIYDGEGMSALRLVPEDWAARQDIVVWRGRIAGRVDADAHELVLARVEAGAMVEGERLPYDRLVLATGARSTPPDAEFLNAPNAFVLRSADDARAIRDYVQRRRAQRALVVGGGVLGVEAADALHKLGLKVTLLQRADRLMNAQLDEPGAAKLQGYLESIGLQVLTNTSVTRYEGRPQLQAAWLSHGPRVRADVFVAALGIQANTFLAEQAGLVVGDNGILVNRHMQTSRPDIYAVGDVAELKGTPRGLWPIGAAHASTAVEAMLGTPVPYATPRIVLQLKCEGIDLRSQGDIVAREGDEEFHARDGDEAWWRLIVRSGQLAGGLYVGPPGSAKAFTKLLQQPVDLAPLRVDLRAGRLDALKTTLGRA
jgi:NADPH-dependent 2,4-dienoyl-CoA reductase/sulfur reductase-like enzyme/ferredoxin